MELSDTFLSFDHAVFPKGNFANRATILWPSEKNAGLITMPVVSGQVSYRDAKFSREGARAMHKLRQRVGIEFAGFAGRDHAVALIERMEEIYEAERAAVGTTDFISALSFNVRTISTLRALFDIETPTLSSFELGATIGNPTRTIADLARKTGLSHYLIGRQVPTYWQETYANNLKVIVFDPPEEALVSPINLLASFGDFASEKFHEMVNATKMEVL